MNFALKFLNFTGTPSSRRLNRDEQELKRKVGAPVKFRRIERWGAMEDEGLHKLTPAMITQLKTVTEQFSKFHPVKELHYVMNDYLYNQFNRTKAKFRKLGRST